MMEPAVDQQTKRTSSSDPHWQYVRAVVKDAWLRVDRWVLLAALLVGGTLAILSVMRYTGYNAGMLDIGNMSQAIWSATQGRPLLYTREGGTFSRLSWHVEVIYFFLAPLYALFPSPVTLLVVQALLFASGAFPLFAFALRRLENVQAARFVALIYLFYPVAETAVLFDFHGDTLAMPFLMFMLNALDRRAWRSYAVWLVLALSCKFYVSAVVVAMSAVLYLEDKRRPAVLTALVALLWGALAFFVIRPAVSPPGVVEVQASASGYLRFYFGHIREILNLYSVSQRLMTAVIVFAPALWVGWRAARWLLPAGLITGLSLMSAGAVSAYDYRFHHYAIAVPFLLAAIVYGAAALRDRQRSAGVGRRVGRPWRMELGMTLSITVLFTALLVDIPLNPLFWIASPGWGRDSAAYGRTARDALKDRWLRTWVPDTVPVATSMLLAPHIVNREVVYLFDYPDDTKLQSMTERLAVVDYAVADALYDFNSPLPDFVDDIQTGVPALSRFGVGHPPSSSGGVFHDVEAIAQLLNTPDFGLVETRDGLLLFQRDADPERALSQRVSAQSLALPENLMYDFENGIGLQDVQITPLGERRFQMHFTWIATSAWEPGRSLFAVSRLEDVEQARIVHLPTQALYPVSYTHLTLPTKRIV